MIENSNSSNKAILTAKEVAEYTGYSLTYLYKLVHERKIKFHKPAYGRKLFFLKADIEQWLLSNVGLTKEQIIIDANRHK